jgi:hypothetical protein
MRGDSKNILRVSAGYLPRSLPEAWLAGIYKSSEINDLTMSATDVPRTSDQIGGVDVIHCVNTKSELNPDQATRLVSISAFAKSDLTITSAKCFSSGASGARPANAAITPECCLAPLPAY